MAWLKFSANSYFVPRLLLLRIIVKRAAQSPTSDFIKQARGSDSRNSTKAIYGWNLLAKSDVMKPALVEPLREETNELIAIFVTMTKNVKNRRR